MSCFKCYKYSITLNLILTPIGNQCNWHSAGVMWQNRRVFVINLAAIIYVPHHQYMNQIKHLVESNVKYFLIFLILCR